LSRRKWKIGNVELELDTEVKGGKDPVPGIFSGPPGLGEPDTARSTEREPARLVAERPLLDWILLLPVIFAAVWWRWKGISGWSWALAPVAFACVLVHTRRVRRRQRERAD